MTSQTVQELSYWQTTKHTHKWTPLKTTHLALPSLHGWQAAELCKYNSTTRLSLNNRTYTATLLNNTETLQTVMAMSSLKTFQKLQITKICNNIFNVIDHTNNLMLTLTDIFCPFLLFALLSYFAGFFAISCYSLLTSYRVKKLIKLFISMHINSQTDFRLHI